jgi:hypothetical protein
MSAHGRKMMKKAFIRRFAATVGATTGLLAAS